MNLREWLNNNSAVTTTGALVLLLAALMIVLWSSGVFGGSGGGGKLAYYYDLKTKKLFTAEAGQIPPMKAPSGANNGVVAHVFSCSDCSDASSRFIGWLERYTDQAKKAFEKSNQFPGANPQSDLIRLPKSNAKWVSAASRAGDHLMHQAKVGRCKNIRQLQICHP